MKVVTKLCVFFIFLLTVSFNAHAVLEIEITQGVEGAMPIAIVQFGGEAFGEPEGVEKIVRADLHRSGFFSVMEPAQFPERPVQASQIHFAAWRQNGIETILIGRIRNLGEQYRIEFELFDMIRKQRLLGHSISAPPKDLRKVAHKISDVIFEKLTGIKGAFSTRVAYVSTINKGAGGQKFILQIADSDGFNPRTIFSSSKQLMSPAWSPDGARLAFVSFENNNSEIFVQDIIQGSRIRVSARAGINSAPAWSPDGKQLAMTLSSDGNPDIYVMDLGSRNLRRLTKEASIDTEPTWIPDGKGILFTSDRSGSPQIYRMSITGGGAARVTFDGKYNAAADVSPDGRYITMVHDHGNGFQIAVMDLQSKAMRIVTNGNLDESPSFAPNGSMIIYGTVDQGRGVLSAVSADGRVKQRLTLQEGDVREPSWSPFRL